MIIAVIADDFTGANDNGALLAAKGFSSATCLGLAHWNPREFTQCDAVCLNAESRLLHRQEAWKAVYDAVRAFNLEKPALVSKRIDSTLRGNVGAELEAVIKAMDDSHGHNETLAVMVSSYPHSGRICVGGYQIVHGVPLERSPIAKDAATPVHHTAVLKIIADQTSLPCGFVSLEKVLAGPAAVREAIEAARARGCRAVVCDAVSDDDIAVIAQSLADAPYPLVSLDPGPFTAELAAARIKAPRAEFENRIFLTVGSTSELTRVQMEALRLAHPCHIVPMDVRKVLAGEAESQAECRRVLDAVFAAPEDTKVLGVCTATSKEDVFSMQEMSQRLGIAPSEISRRYQHGPGPGGPGNPAKRQPAHRRPVHLGRRGYGFGHAQAQGGRVFRAGHGAAPCRLRPHYRRRAPRPAHDHQGRLCGRQGQPCGMRGIPVHQNFNPQTACLDRSIANQPA